MLLGPIWLVVTCFATAMTRYMYMLDRIHVATAWTPHRESPLDCHTDPSRHITLRRLRVAMAATTTTTTMRSCAVTPLWERSTITAVAVAGDDQQHFRLGGNAL